MGFLLASHRSIWTLQFELLEFISSDLFSQILTEENIIKICYKNVTNLINVMQCDEYYIFIG